MTPDLFHPHTILDARKRQGGAVSPGAKPHASTTPESSEDVVGLAGQAGVRRPGDQPRKADTGYFNTTNLTGKALVAARRDAMTQEDRITKLFATMPDGWTATPSKVHQHVGGRAPITSIRRAMTNLTDQGVLTRTETKMMGPCGKPEYTWRRAV